MTRANGDPVSDFVPSRSEWAARRVGERPETSKEPLSRDLARPLAVCLGTSFAAPMLFPESGFVLLPASPRPASPAMPNAIAGPIDTAA